MILTYRYRLLPSKRQHRALERLCEDQRQLYNAALEERIDCYHKTGKGVSYIDQCKSLTICRRNLPEIAGGIARRVGNVSRWAVRSLRNTCFAPQGVKYVNPHLLVMLVLTGVCAAWWWCVVRVVEWVAE